MTPKEEIQCLEQLLEQLRLQLRFQPDALRLLEEAIREHIARLKKPILFAWPTPGEIWVDGKPLPSRGMGLKLAWLCVAGVQLRLEPLQVSALYPDRRAPGKCAQQAIRRAASDVEAHHPRLASVLRRIGVERGRLVVKGTPPLLECTSKWLPRFAASVERLQLPYDFGVTRRA
jgi:hypothetical protein